MNGIPLTDAIKAREQTEKLLRMLGDKLGLGVHIDVEGQDREGVHLKVSLLPINDDGSVVTPEERQFRRVAKNAAYKGIEPDDYGLTIYIAGANGTYILRELKFRNRKYPLICEKVGSGGKRYKFSLNEAMMERIQEARRVRDNERLEAERKQAAEVYRERAQQLAQQAQFS